MHGHICGYKNKKLAIKFSRTPGSKINDDMIHSYTNKIDGRTLKGIKDKGQNSVMNFIGMIEDEVDFKKGKEIIIKFDEITGNNRPETLSKSMKIKPTEGIFFLGESSTRDWVSLKIKTEEVPTKGEFLKNDFKDQTSIFKLLK
jgi:hypothetical protein